MNFCKIAMAVLVFAGAVAPVISGEEKDVPPLSPLSSMVAVTSKTRSIPVRVKNEVSKIARGLQEEGKTFPLENKITDSVRSLDLMTVSVVAKWMDQLTNDASVFAPRFGANCDFIAYFGDDWNADWEGDIVGSSAQFSGSSTSGWIWTNHEYISNNLPTTSNAPTGQHMTLARFLAKRKVLENDIASETWSQGDVDTYTEWHKRQLGGAWFRVRRNPAGAWEIVLDDNAKRYDATSNTLTSVVGFNLSRNAKDDAGADLPPNVAPGIMGDCSGGMTPWGTVFTAEENVQGYYGDLETAWSSSNRFIPGTGFDPGANISISVEASRASAFGLHSEASHRKDRDNYGFLVEIDPGEEPDNYYVSINDGGDGKGHRKVGTMGRVRWENATFYVGPDFNLVDDQPIVVYGANDRRSGRIYKFVSSQPYQSGMTRGEVRALLDDGDLYVSHFEGLAAHTGRTLFDPNDPTGPGIVPTEESRGMGRWILMSLAGNDEAPNAAALGAPGTSVGAALQDNDWNSIGGFATQNDVLAALFTAANKLGVSELNRPEDVEYNPLDLSGTPRIYVAFTNHTRPSANNQDGILDGATPSRSDRNGSIFAMEEGNPTNPSASTSFTYWQAWGGTLPEDEAGLYDAVNPDNLAVDSKGGLYFGTDGNAGSTGDTKADAIYYLDLDPAHKEGAEGIVKPTYGLPFRIVSGPGDSEATGPWFTPDERTLFFNVQHPGEDLVRTPSTWPQDRDGKINQRRFRFKNGDDE